MLQFYREPPDPPEVDEPPDGPLIEPLDVPPIEPEDVPPIEPLLPLFEPLPTPPVVAAEPGEEPLLVLSLLELVELRVVLDVLPVVPGVSLDIDPVPLEPRFVVLELDDESLPLVPPRFMLEPDEPPLVPPLMPEVPLPLPLVPPMPLEPPDDCAYAILMVAAKTAAARLAPILVVAFMLFS